MHATILSEATVGSEGKHVGSDGKHAGNDSGDTHGFVTDIKKFDSNFINKYFRYKTDIVWRNVIVMLYLHISLLYALYLIFTGRAMIKTTILSLLAATFLAFGVTAGAHRLWTHRAYKATWQLRLLLMILNSGTFQNCIHEWVRDHRVHHKHTETDADPHNAARGFFFSHMGWLMLKKHPDVIRKGKEIDMSDIERDAIVMFQKRNYYWLMPLFTFVLPAASAHYFLGETLSNSWYVASIFRYLIAVHGTWCVNSVTHYSGSKPYDKNIAATNNTYVGILGIGEGWHNYHHVFPWDYKTSELGDHRLNLTCGLIDMFAKIGWAYDLKTVPEDLIRKRAERTGDGIPYKYSKCIPNRAQLVEQISHHHLADETLCWGWEDKDMDLYEKDHATILNKKKSE